MQRSAFCRSRRELSNAYFLAKIGFDTAENEPCQVCRPLRHAFFEAWTNHRGDRFSHRFSGLSCLSAFLFWTAWTCLKAEDYCELSSNIVLDLLRKIRKVQFVTLDSIGDIYRRMVPFKPYYLVVFFGLFLLVVSISSMRRMKKLEVLSVAKTSAPAI